MNLRTYLLGAKSSIPEAKRKAIADKESAVIAAQKGRSLPKPDEDTLRSEQIEKQVGSGLTAEELDNMRSPAEREEAKKRRSRTMLLGTK